MKLAPLCLVSFLVAASSPAQTSLPAQTTAPASTQPVSVTAATPANTAPDASGKYILREGEDVNLKFSDNLSSKTAAEGDQVSLTLTDDVKVGDVVVVKAGAHAIGEITKASKAGMMGKAGELSMRLDYLKQGDTKIHLRGTKGKEGESGTTGAVVLTVLFGPIGLIKHGKEVEIKAGQPLHAYVSDDVALVPAS